MKKSIIRISGEIHLYQVGLRVVLLFQAVCSDLFFYLNLNQQ
jgi:hypothetical protein